MDDTLIELLPYMVGFAFTLFAGHYYVRAVVVEMYRLKENHDGPINASGYTSMLIGHSERIIFVVALLISQPLLIGVWLAIKAAGEWRKADHELYQIFLVGTALSLMYGVAGFLVIEHVFKNPQLILIGLLGFVLINQGLITLLERKPTPAFNSTRKTCPQCAESVKTEAKVCNHCGHAFEPTTGKVSE